MENFYIGQDIVAIVDHSQGCFKKDDIFSALDVDFTKCCNKPLVDIGIKEIPALMYQGGCDCGAIEFTRSPVIWFYSKCFVPLDSLVNIEELTEILEFELIT